MVKRKRQIVKIDEEKCDGCGECILACQEGALQIIDGKARLVGEIYCDGLGACLSVCPQGAITVEEREAEEFDPEAVERLKAQERTRADACSCPGSAVRQFEPKQAYSSQDLAESRSSCLSHWPVQIHLVPPFAEFLKGAKLLICADCVPFAYPDLHQRFLKGRVVLVGCPKLDDVEFYQKKLAQIFLQAKPKELEIVYMEVPCCFGMVHLIKQAIAESGQELSFRATKISIQGEILESVVYNQEQRE